MSAYTPYMIYNIVTPGGARPPLCKYWRGQWPPWPPPFLLHCIATHTNLIISFKSPSTFVIQLFKSRVLSRNSYRNTISQSSFKSSETHTSRPLSKLKCSVLLVMYSWLNGYLLQKRKHYLTLFQ